MIEITLIIAFLVLLAASITDIKKNEVPDWLSFSFIAVAFIIAVSKSVIYSDSSFILKSLLGFAVFFVIANLFYFGKLFAGADAKLLIGMGALLGIDFSFLANLLIIGGFYGLIYAAVLASLNFKKTNQELKKMKIPLLPFFIIFIFSLITAILFKSVIFYFIAFLAIFSPLLYAFAFAVEKAALIKLVKPEKITEGDWLANDITVKGKTIKATFEGLSKSDISLIKKAKKSVIIKYGLPFVPVFLLAFLAEIIFGNLLLRILGI
jgi:Flp pilus assembly protein protease CpaA